MVTIVNGKDVRISLPLQYHPTTLFLPTLNAPGILVSRAEGERGVQGVWIRELNNLNQMVDRGTPNFTTAVLDTVHFCQLLAKIAHGYAVSLWGVDTFNPLLPEFILREFGAMENWPQCYHLVGGDPRPYEPNDALHVLGWGIAPTNGQDYLVVAIRLFANLGAPVFHVVVGTPTDRMRLTPIPAPSADP